MKILVTGGAGFIGSNFIIYIMEKYPDYKIVNLDKLTYAGNLENLKKVENNPNYTFIHGDICDRKIVERAMEGCQTVVHFAAESHVDRSIDQPAVFIQTNIIGTEILLEVAKELNIKRFHHVSTDEVFGTLSLNNLEEKFNETTPYSPRSPYSASKAGSDHLVRAFFETYNFPATISNCTNNYGPFQFPEKIIPLFITNAFEDKPLPIYGKGQAIRDYLYVIDHCVALDLIIHKGKIGETYCIGGDSEKNGVEIADTILNLLDKPQNLKTFVEDRKGHDMRYAMDHSKITRELGWKPSVSFEEGIKKTIAWYKNKKWKK
ncbi:dTDP-glucose 4,6-dehydratase [Candidatus Nomurabacteria bacterium RIFCSPLOWO2_01_FULL_39_18]|uniref:dTDP-glucose 4,6-dehydratase n=1 Tax=Candidatus Nomurabacteria bacterium RIFCSPHIGHO2_01_FULL_40_24b TaxID=1801739 RepID=A0A1F6V815_9BACT|nr:MAG: dTDP-glucose 4,6-dehydratase [Candidatus Nomurabacteria bacterium RIFCSPHIGHO2_01_FULL_40_24b]OGI88919.1 MAG: dTDP-glucose 4,6-dehydratase [Candidatus Nomurabacteria bacterium RIFCSPLOWO2_01_FULL_39_18]